jgi:iron complex transport system ATP-binding protein
VIELHNVSGGYNGREVIRDVSLSFQPGRLTAIVGPNGCGKSTLLKLMCGHLEPINGGVFINDKPLAGLTRNEIARQISYLPQVRTVPDIAVGTLVLHGRFPWLSYPRIYRAEDRDITELAMERAGIKDYRRKNVMQLSGGERQKAYLAMLLAQDTPVILLDEPTTYLDIANQLELAELMLTLKNEEKTIIAVVHDLNLALQIADEIAVIKDGQLLLKETSGQILASCAMEEAFGVSITESRGYDFKLI